MGRIATGATALCGLAMILFAVSGTGYSQNSTSCSQFQRTVAYDLAPGGSSVLKVTSGTSATIEMLSLKIETTNSVVPTISSVATTTGGVQTTYYLPMPIDFVAVGPYRPLTLLAPVKLYADSGTDITFSTLVDARYTTGTGRAEWSVSGLSCGR